MEKVEENVLDKYRIEGIDPVLSTKVCLALKTKWLIIGDTTLNMPKMCEFFKSDRETLTRIVHWYENHLIDTRFTIND